MKVPDPRWARVHAMARRQAGCFTTAQARAEGIGKDELAALVRRGHLLRLHPAVWTSAWTPPTSELAEHAALLRLGSRSVLSHLSAGAFHGVVARPDRPWLSVPSTHRAPGDGSMTVLRTRHLDVVTVTDGRRVTSAARTVVDLGQCLSERELTAALLTLLQRGACTTAGVVGAVAGAGSPYPGSALVRQVLATFTVEFESILGVEAWELLRDHVPGLVVGYVVRTEDGRIRTCDLAVPELRIDIEADSWAWHGSRDQQEADRARDRAMAASGWLTVRLGTSDIRGRGPRSVREVVAVVERRHAGRAA